MRVKFFVGAAVIALAMGLGSPAIGPALAADAKDSAKFSQDTYKYLELFGDVFERVRKDYVEDVSDQELLENAINGMLTGLDPHSSYIPAKNFQAKQEELTGEYGGVGFMFDMDRGLIKVISPIDDTPASRAGIQPGDYVIAIDGKSVIGLKFGEIEDKIKGPANSPITITVRRPGVDPFDLKLVRAIIKVPTVTSRAETDVGYIRITQFTEQTQPGLEKALKDLKEKIGSANIKGYVLDLRNNPGGLVDQAVSVADTFLDRGEIVSIRSRRPEDTQRFNAKPGDMADGKPMVVLINDGSASASEIVAGALQDHGRAILLGTRSFGKGSVQTIIPLDHGESAMALTTARYYTPSGRSIQGLGITPDIEVQELKVEKVASNESSFHRAEADLPGALKNDTVKPDAVKPDAGPAPDAGGKQPVSQAPGPASSSPPQTNTAGDTADDYQLSRALDVLRGIAIYEHANASAGSVVR